MTDYDASNDTFYCADPAGSSRGRIKFANSTIKGSGQDGKLYYINGIWYITNRSGGGTPTLPSNTWVKVSCGETGYTTDSIQLTWGATDATSYWMQIFKDGELITNKSVSNAFNKK